MRLNWEARNPEERRKLQFYTNERIIGLLISTGRICDTSFLVNIKDKEISNEHTLLITEQGRFWVVPIIEATAGISSGVMIFNCKTGQRISNKDLIEKISKIKSSFCDLNWIIEDDNKVNMVSKNLIEESQSIVTVSGGDQWADYRPSRPQDFVGRDGILSDIFDMLNNVTLSKTNTRLFAITSPSGWGKSSVVLKLIDLAKSKKNRNKYFIYGVDVRTAMSNRYAELSLKACIEAAMSENFISKNPVKVTSIANAFEDMSMKNIIEELKNNQKTIVLVFDQFEEIFSKKELSTLFDNIKKLSYSVDAIKENFVLGFAWKTDLSIPADHSAYYMWHSLSDRRREFELTQFSGKDISKALGIFTKEIGAPMNPILKKYLTDQCQGYPWLLKKLSIHVYSSIKSGTDQNEILGQGLNIKELFEKDLRELTPVENRCINEIAKESPADFFKMSEVFGNEVIQCLLNKRLIIQRASRLILYWDIFKDYVLTKTIPEIIVNYIPQTTFMSFKKVVSYLLKDKELTTDEMASKLNISKKAVENIVVDLAMFSIIERKDNKIVLVYENIDDALSKVHDFFRNHILIKKLTESSIENSVDSFEIVFSSIYNSYKYADKTRRAYISKILSWFVGIGIIKLNGNKITIVDENSIDGFSVNVPNNSRNYLFPRRKGRISMFLGQAPPKSLSELYKLINSGDYTKKQIYEKGYRNAVSVFESIESIQIQGNIVKISLTYEEVLEEIGKTDTMKLALEHLNNNKNASYVEIGKFVGESLGKTWTSGSQRRYGGGLAVWCTFFKNR